MRPRVVLIIILTVVALGGRLTGGDEQYKYSWKANKWQAQKLTPARRVPIRVQVPAGHNVVTVAIDDARGRRVRNLAGMRPVSDFGGKAHSREAQWLQLEWNGLDDAGRESPPGDYVIRGLSLPGLRVKFDYAWYNPGNPPWQGFRHSGWGGDHSGPTGVACAPPGSASRWRTVITWPVVESPHATIALDADGRKVWGFKRAAGFAGPHAVAIADGLLWAGVEKDMIKLFLDSGKNRGWKKPAGWINALPLSGKIIGIAVGSEYAVALVAGDKRAPKCRLVFLDKKRGFDRKTKKALAEIVMQSPVAGIAYAPNGRLHAATGRGIMTVTLDGAVTPIKIQGLRKPGPLAFDAKANLYVMDRGPDYQIKVFSPALKLLRTIGTKGGQRGLKIDYDALRSVSSLAIDDQGQVWVTETTHPRRVSVWGGEGETGKTTVPGTGRLIRDFIGCTQYGAANCILHEQDPTLAAAYGMLFGAVDPKRTNEYRPLRFLSSPPKTGRAGATLKRSKHAPLFPRGKLFRSRIAGRKHEYYLSPDNGYPILYLERDGDYRPVAAVGTKESTDGVLKAPGRSAQTICVWSDENGDELVQPAEVKALPADAGARYGSHYRWVGEISTDLVFYAGGYELRPSRYGHDGAPVYDPSKARKLGNKDLFLRAGKHLIGQTGGAFKGGHYYFADLDGKVIATYPLVAMGVHSSMHAPVLGPGYTMGDLFFSGTADTGGDLGTVVAVQGNMGQVFLFSEDGLFVSALFRDCRTRPPGWPAKAGKGVDLTDTSMLQEPFGSWFGKQDDGQVRVLFGRNAAIVCRVEGLADVKRLTPLKLALADQGAAPLTTARIENVPAAVLTVPDLRKQGNAVIRVDGNLEDWRGLAVHKLTAGKVTVGTVALAHDGKKLYVCYRVKDKTPLRNKGQDFKACFKEGDCVDLQLGTAAAPRARPAVGDLRVVFAPTRPDATTVVYKPLLPGAQADDRRTEFKSPIGSTVFDFVGKDKTCQVVFKVAAQGYICEAALPFATLGVKPERGLKVYGDIGVFASDQGGQTTTSRTYLFNRVATMTADLSVEARLTTPHWGTLVLE